MTDIIHSLPLTPAVFHILLALAKEDKHGYEIMKSVRQDSNDKVKMGNGTLYGSLKRMLSDGLIEDAGDRAEGDDTRRKYYKLTSLGREALNAEIERYITTTEPIKNSTWLRTCHLQIKPHEKLQLIYNVILKFYPRNYRKAFGAQMMQTFSDHYQDIIESKGRVSIIFWLSTITDEIKNITRQHFTV